MDATFVALKTSNVRAKPTTGAERVGRLTRDDAVAVTGKVRDGNWYRIEYEGGTAYVFGTLIKEVDLGELAAWEKVADTSERADVERFLKDYPKGHFAERAKGLMAALVPPPALTPADTSVESAVVVPPPITTGPPPLHACDRLAASPSDANRVGDGVAVDKLKPDRAIAACQAAISEYPRAPRFQYQLGRAYSAGEQYAEALRWYRKAVEQDYAVAQNNLGWMYQNGRGVSQDDAEAVKWFRKAADQGVAFSQTNLGMMSANGIGVSQADYEAV